MAEACCVGADNLISGLRKFGNVDTSCNESGPQWSAVTHFNSRFGSVRNVFLLVVQRVLSFVFIPRLKESCNHESPFESAFTFGFPLSHQHEFSPPWNPLSHLTSFLNMVADRGPGTVRVAMVQGHATDDTVERDRHELLKISLPTLVVVINLLVSQMFVGRLFRRG